jgi:hypothetical protein
MGTEKRPRGRVVTPRQDDALATPPAAARTRPAAVPLSYRIGTWGGVPNYSCKRCPFATTDRADMVLHVARRHGAETREGKGDTHS